MKSNSVGKDQINIFIIEKESLPTPGISDRLF